MTANTQAALPVPSRRASRALDALNFFSADVRDGVGPFLAVWLIAQPGWDAQKIGLAMSAAGLASLVVQTPLGAFTDATRHKRLLLAAAIVAISLACIALGLSTSFVGVFAAQIVTGVAAAVIAPALGGITLGLVGADRLSDRQSRNEAWNHGGNVVSALLAIWLSSHFSIAAVFYANAALGLCSLLAAWALPAREIDHDIARGFTPEQLGERKSERGQDRGKVRGESWWSLLKRPGLGAFVLACAIFHFANAAMLPLAGQVLAIADPDNAGAWLSGCILIAQLVMVPTALLAGRFVRRIGWGKLLAIGFLVLPLRGVLLTLDNSGPWILLVQALDGVGAGLFGVLSVIAIADLTRGSGRFNAAQGLAITATGLGAALSPAVAGALVHHASYSAAFLVLAALAVAAVGVLWVGIRQVPPHRPQAAPTAA